MTDLKASSARTHLPGDGHMWFMVLGDLFIFGSYFIAYLVFRTRAPEQFLADQQHLNITIGVINTIVLITSSWLVAQSVQSARAGDRTGAVRLVRAGALCGVMFAVLKVYEWSAEIHAGHTNSSAFFSFYYVLTGVHLFHVGLGLLILGVVIRELRNPRRARVSMVEQGATYWHMVDLLWVVIFALLYVMR
ncbi:MULTISPECIES: cytochrome c oxidase subunit 3 [Mycolicibacter]|uniref:cytochrome c oxidase subunit 3 n=1 Tax=Mycolicibacter TaxID=1073531 RepID=UPI0007E94AC8|nr:MULTISPECIES: cytochrome c oxidase subunit 3 [Mycolicibacter]OBG33323.1 cytochrome C oxidase subunit III [Mycolicibacter heraklionensis]ULP46990.1 cytochrome c oxidase subunit 3 [Mycolicibacter virginiensis]